MRTRPSFLLALRRAAVVAAAMALCQPTLAQTSFAFVGAGLLTPTAPPSDTGEVAMRAIGAVDVSGSGRWNLVSDFLLDPVSGTGFGTFVFEQGSSSLSGTLNTNFAIVASGIGFDMQYTATSGTGDLAGFVASANSLVRLDGGFDGDTPYAYIEAGIMTLSPVPEPVSGLLMLCGVAALAGLRRRAAD